MRDMGDDYLALARAVRVEAHCRRTKTGKSENVESYIDSVSTVALATKGRLDWSPKKNWVENAGGLPKYIEDIALALIRDHGFTRERAIATAVNRVKKWAAGGGDVNADTRAKAAKAVAEWEALKAKNAVRQKAS